MNHITTQLRRGMGRRFWLAVAASAALVMLSYLHPLLQIQRELGGLRQGLHTLLFSDALSSDILASFLPVLTAIPLAAGYLQDVKSKFARFLLIRGSRSQYLIGMALACWLCGGLAVLMGTGAAYGLTVLALAPMERAMEDCPPVQVHIAGKLLLLTLNGGLWAVLGMTLSTLMESSYIAYASPFVVYYLLIILAERYFPKVWLIHPQNWQNPERWPHGIGSAVLFLLALTALLGLLFYRRGRRRLAQL